MYIKSYDKAAFDGSVVEAFDLSGANTDLYQVGYGLVSDTLLYVINNNSWVEDPLSQIIALDKATLDVDTTVEWVGDATDLNQPWFATIFEWVEPPVVLPANSYGSIIW